MATVTGTVTVNVAFLREIKDDNRDLRNLLNGLRTFTRSVHSLRNHRQRFLQLLVQLRDQLALHFTLEEAYGYFRDALDVAPRLSVRAEQLRSEHSVLFAILCDIVDETEGLPRTAPALRLVMIARRFRDFDAELQQHELNENELILEAMDQDIGVGD